MKPSWKIAAAAALSLFAACKTAGNKAGVKDEEVAPAGDADAPPAPVVDGFDEALDQAVQGVAFDVNDASILFPKGADGFPYPNVVLDGLKDARGGEVWPKATAFQPLLDFAQDKAPGGPGAGQAPVFTNFGDGTSADSSLSLADTPQFKSVSIKSFFDRGTEASDASSVVKLEGPLAPVLSQANWRVLSLRADPCAEQGSRTCNVEFRLIVQPFDPATKKPLDVAAHLLYNMGALDLTAKEIPPSKRTPNLPANITFRNMVNDLRVIKQATQKIAGGDTNGVGLGTHPGLAAEAKTAGAANGALAKLIVAFIKKYTQGGLTTTTSMQLTKPGQPWLFFVGEVKGGQWTPVTITGGTPTFFIRFDAGQKSFTPVPQNSGGRSNSNLMGDAPTATDFTNAFVIDNPGKYGVVGQRNSVENTDCISCHVGATAIRRIAGMTASVHGLANNPQTGKAAMYVPAEGVTGYMGTGPDGVASAVADGSWDFRNFGAHNRGVNTSVESRQLNEAAEVARFLNQDVLNVANAGFVCKAGASEADRAKNHAALWDCNVKGGKALAECAKTVCGAAP